MKETVASDRLWEEMDLYIFRPPGLAEQLETIGFPENTIQQALRRGIMVIGIANNLPRIKVIENTPAEVFFNSLDTSMDDDLTKQTLREKFYKDSFNLPDDEHFKAQWPELF